MPLTLTVTEGVLPTGKEKVAFSKLCETFLRWHGLEGNTVMTPNVVGSIHVIPKEHTFSGAEESSVAFIEWKVPSFAFANTEIQQGFFAEATSIVHDLSEGKLAKDKIWINVLHAVDGAWGIDGDALTNDQLKEAISAG
ncbi:4-oxalocrotonate tautomerase [Gammaproteobacteria bacterium 45_16_T64]|nr:4-oxalocrotonate tautomerase [Gammaproteobacteria bacterium 45_16_T64]